jgi:hypothetical protein
MFDVVCIDLVGPFPLTQDKKTMLLTMIDPVSRRAVAIPIPSGTSKHIIQALCTHWLDEFGVPKLIISDNANNISGGMLKVICREIGMKRRCVLPYSPWANGINERCNGTLVNMISKFISEAQEQHNRWDKYVSKAVFAYNTSIHSYTGYSPFFLTHGREARIGSMSVLVGQKFTRQSFPIYIQQIIKDMAKAHAEVRARVQKGASERDEKNVERVREVPAFSVGDVVYVYKFIKSDKSKGVMKKLTSPYSGPYTITHSYNSVSFKIRHNETKVVERAHATWLKKVDLKLIAINDDNISAAAIPILLPIITTNTNNNNKHVNNNVSSLGPASLSSFPNNNTNNNHINNNDDSDDDFEDGEVRMRQVKNHTHTKTPIPFPATIHSIPSRLDTKLLCVGVSTIPGAGLGVFVKKSVKLGKDGKYGKAKAKVLCEYVGKRVEAVEDPFPADLVYKVQSGKYWWSPTPASHNIGMYINTLLPAQMSKQGVSFNCRLSQTKYKGETVLRIYASRDLKKGEELFWDYGDNYWDEKLLKEVKERERGIKKGENNGKPVVGSQFNPIVIDDDVVVPVAPIFLYNQPPKQVVSPSAVPYVPHVRRPIPTRTLPTTSFNQSNLDSWLTKRHDPSKD